MVEEHVHTCSRVGPVLGGAPADNLICPSSARARLSFKTLTTSRERDVESWNNKATILVLFDVFSFHVIGILLVAYASTTTTTTTTTSSSSSSSTTTTT
jgi:hypothetical protein